MVLSSAGNSLEGWLIRARSKDPLAAATTSIFLPALSPWGFRRRSNRDISRISNEILQFFYIQLSGYGGKDFCINYASLSLFNPRDYLILTPGARLRQQSGGELWAPSLSHEEADASMELCVQLAREQAIPFFEATNTVEGLLNCLTQEGGRSDHHGKADIAFCLARLGRLEESSEHFRVAIDLYRADGRSWCPPCIKLCEEVLESIRSDRVGETLDRFTSHSISRLKLQKLHN